VITNQFVKMAAFKFTACLAILLLSAGIASARQLQLFGWGDNGQQQTTFGVPIVNFLCAKQDYQTMCSLLQAAGRGNPTVAQFSEPGLTVTLFVPDDDAWNSNGKKVLRHLGLASLQDLVTQSDALAKVLTTHCIVGQALQYAQLHNDYKYVSAGGSTLEIDTGLFGKYVKGPHNTVKISGTETKHNMQAARSMLHKVDEVIIPR